MTGGDAYVIAAKRATATIPIVFASAGDPVGNGLVESLARPGGNVTGLSIQLTETVGKRLGLLREVSAASRSCSMLRINRSTWSWTRRKQQRAHSVSTS